MSRPLILSGFILLLPIILLATFPFWGNVIIQKVFAVLSYPQTNIQKLSPQISGFTLEGVLLMNKDHHIMINRIDVNAFPKPTLIIEGMTLTISAKNLFDLLFSIKDEDDFLPFSEMRIKNSQIVLEELAISGPISFQAASQRENHKISFQLHGKTASPIMSFDTSMNGFVENNTFQSQGRLDTGRFELKKRKASRITAAWEQKNTYLKGQVVIGNVLYEGRNFQDVNISFDSIGPDFILLNALSGDNLNHKIAMRVTADKKEGEIVIFDKNNPDIILSRTSCGR